MESIENQGKIERAVIDPMRLRWSPPKGSTPERQAALLDDLYVDLEKFPEAVLAEAFARVRKKHRFASWPSSAEFLAEALAIQDEKAANLQPRNNQTGRAKLRIEQQWEEAGKLRDDYVQHFKATSKVYQQALAEKWDFELWQWVKEAAWVQGQLIAGCDRIAWDSLLVQHFPPAERLTAFQKHMLPDWKRQAEYGVVDVAIPTTLIDRLSTKIRLNYGNTPPAKGFKTLAQASEAL